MRRSMKKDAGFTLVELMTVLVIIGLMSSAVVLTLPKEKPAFDKQVDTLVQHMNLAAQDSILTGKPHAWGVSETSHGFFKFQENTWDELKISDWSPSFRFSLTRETTTVEPQEEILPLIVFEPTGVSTPFVLFIEDGNRRVKIEGQPDGSILKEEIN